MIDQKLKNLHRIVAFNVKGTIDKLDQLRSAFNEVEQILLRPLDVKIANTHFDAGQTKLAAEWATAAGFEVNDAIGQMWEILFKPMR
jgi:hypothetical protein